MEDLRPPSSSRAMDAVSPEVRNAMYALSASGNMKYKEKTDGGIEQDGKQGSEEYFEMSRRESEISLTWDGDDSLGLGEAKLAEGSVLCGQYG